MADFHSMVEEVRTLINAKLRDRARPQYMLERQLHAILDEIDKMDRIRDAGQFFPYYPKGISESWNCLDPLGLKLSELLDAYRRL